MLFDIISRFTTRIFFNSFMSSRVMTDAFVWFELLRFGCHPKRPDYPDNYWDHQKT